MSTTQRQATEEWVAGFDRVPASVIKKMASADEAMTYYDSDSLRLIAGPTIECTGCGATYEGDLSLDELEARAADGHCEPCPACKDNDGDQWTRGYPRNAFPCGWSTLFAPRDSSDNDWLLEHAEEVAALGFYVFESEDYGCLLGIDGAGFDFYEAFWVPLYRLRGLRWHEAD